MTTLEKKICGGVQLNGSICQNYPGKYTNHFGEGRCKEHDGKVDGRVVDIFNVASINERMMQLKEDGNVYTLDKELALLRAHLELVSQYINELKEEQDNGIKSYESNVNYAKLTTAINQLTNNIAKLIQVKHDIEVGRKYVIHVSQLSYIMEVIGNVIDTEVIDYDTRMRIHDGFNRIQLPTPEN